LNEHGFYPVVVVLVSYHLATTTTLKINFYLPFTATLPCDILGRLLNNNIQKYSLIEIIIFILFIYRDKKRQPSAVF